MKTARNYDKKLFGLGQTVTTQGALAAIKEATKTCADADKAAEIVCAVMLSRHVYGDWGDVCDEDAQLNDDAIAHDNRIMSVYTMTALGVPSLDNRLLLAGVRPFKIWVITERDRSVTTILLPEEY